MVARSGRSASRERPHRPRVPSCGSCRRRCSRRPPARRLTECRLRCALRAPRSPTPAASRGVPRARRGRWRRWRPGALPARRSHLGAVHESLLTGRKVSGAFYTPGFLVDHVLDGGAGPAARPGRAGARARPGVWDRRVPGAGRAPDRGGHRVVARRRGRRACTASTSIRWRSRSPGSCCGSRRRRSRGRCWTRLSWKAMAWRSRPTRRTTSWWGTRRSSTSSAPRPRASRRSTEWGPTPTPARCSCSGPPAWSATAAGSAWCSRCPCSRPAMRRRCGRRSTATASLVSLWASDRPVFDGTPVLTCAPVWERGRPGSGEEWSALAAPSFGIPPVTLPDRARGARRPRAVHRRLPRPVLRPGAVRPRGRPRWPEPGERRLMTTGLIEPAESRWGHTPDPLREAAVRRAGRRPRCAAGRRLAGRLGGLAAGAEGPGGDPGRGAGGASSTSMAPGCRRCRRWCARRRPIGCGTSSPYSSRRRWWRSPRPATSAPACRRDRSSSAPSSWRRCRCRATEPPGTAAPSWPDGPRSRRPPTERGRLLVA